MKTLRPIMALLFVFSLVCGGSDAFLPVRAAEAPEGKTVVAEGVGVLRAGETAIARDQALEDALRKAVEQAVGMMISSETVVQNYQLLSDRIYSKSKGYVRGYQVVSEGPKGENLYVVRIQAKVSEGDIQNDLSALGLLMERKHKPRVMVFFSEQNVGEPVASFWWGGQRPTADLTMAETVMNDRFLAKGFPMIDQKTAAKRIQVGKAYRMADLSNEAARTLGNQCDAEVVIVGKALAKQVGVVEGTSMKSFSGTVTARAVRTDNGAVIATAHATVPTPHIDPVAGGSKAIELAAGKVAEDLIDKIIRVWTSEVEGTTMVQVLVRGLTSYGDFLTFKKILQERVRGVKAVHHRKVSGGEGLMDVDIKGDAQTLAEELSTKRFESLAVEVKNVTQNRVEVEVTRK